MKYLASFLLVLFVFAACNKKEQKAEEPKTDTTKTEVVKEEPKAEVTPPVPAVDQSKPELVVQAVFDAAKSKDFALLKGLCAPDADGDTKMICNLDEKSKEEFIKYFGMGKIDGVPKIEGTKAEVNILFGPDGKKKETMKLVQIDGKWFLQGM